MGTKITKHNRKYLKFEKSQLEEHILRNVKKLPLLHKTIPEVVFKHLALTKSKIISLGNSLKIGIDEFKELFTYFADPQKALKASFDSMLVDLVR